MAPHPAPVLEVRIVRPTALRDVHMVKRSKAAESGGIRTQPRARVCLPLRVTPKRCGDLLRPICSSICYIMLYICDGYVMQSIEARDICTMLIIYNILY